MGRRQELAEASRLLAHARLVTLTGPGGVGKTRLAGQVARQVARAFPDGVWLVPLAAVRDPGLVAQAVADALGIRDETGGAPEEALTAHLRGRRLLLLLDNCEHLPDVCASLVDTLLTAADGVRVLATSRHRLGLTAEHVLPVPPLRVPPPGTRLSGAAAGQFPALDLFADRAAAVDPGFAITDDNRAAVARLCRRLDGLPLAIELAAARMRVLDARGLEERLDDSYRLLTTGSPAAPARHRTLRAAVDWSHTLCTPRERLVWARLSVFAGSFDLRAAEAVCARTAADRAWVLDAVAGLVEKSVLVRADTDGTARYRMLETLRQYGEQRLETVGETGEAHRRLCDHLLDLADAYEERWFGPDQPAIVSRLRAEHDNVRAALHFCLTTEGETRRGLRLVGDLWFYWVARGAWAEMRHWWQRLVEREGARPSDALARAHWVAAAIPVIRSRSTAVLLDGAPAEAPLRADEIPPLKPLAALLAGRPGSGDRLLTFHLLNRVEVACTLVLHGRPESAVPLCTEALAVCEAHGESWIRSHALRTLATAQWALGEYDDALVRARQCLRLEYVTGEPHAIGRTLDVVAAVLAARGDAEQAAVLRGAADRIGHDLGHDPLGAPRQSGRVPVSERQARRVLGDRGYEEAHRRGYALSVQEAADHALRDRPGPPGAPRSPATRPGRAAGAPPEAGLTARERQVAGLIGQGMTNRQIAEALVISRRTAEGHVERVLAKLGFSRRSQVAAWVSGQGGL